MQGMVAAVLVGLPWPLAAAELREYCPDRPGLGTPACIIDSGHVSIELGGLQWTALRAGADRADNLTVADLLLRLGVGSRTEVQLGFGGFGWWRERLNGHTIGNWQAATGDVSLAVRHNLRNPDGSAVAVAVMPWVSLPVGQPPHGSGTWATGVIVPISFELAPRLSLEFTAQVSAAPDIDEQGRHLAYGLVSGFNVSLHPRVSATLEYQIDRDEDPFGSETRHGLGLSMALMPADDLQIDLGGAVTPGGVSRGFTLAAGVSRRF